MEINWKQQPANISLRDQFGKSLVELGEKNENIVVLDADLSSSTRTKYFRAKFPERFFNMGISEQNMVGSSIGLATAGKLPIVSGFTCFTLGRGWEIIRSACIDNLSVKFCTTHAGLSAAMDGGSHQAIEDLALMGTLSNMHIYAPADPQEVQSMFSQIIHTKGPCYLRLTRNALPWVWKNDSSFPTDFQDFISLLYENTAQAADILIFSTGSMTSFLPEILKILEESKHNLKIRAVHVGKIKPLNSEKIVKLAEHSQKIITLEEHNVLSGFGSRISQVISERLEKKVLNIGITDTFGQTGTYSQLLQEYGLDPISVAEKILNFIEH